MQYNAELNEIQHSCGNVQQVTHKGIIQSTVLTCHYLVNCLGFLCLGFKSLLIGVRVTYYTSNNSQNYGLKTSQNSAIIWRHDLIQSYVMNRLNWLWLCFCPLQVMGPQFLEFLCYNTFIARNMLTNLRGVYQKINQFT